MEPSLLQKLSILADAAKYDVSCSSSGSNRSGKDGLGNAARAGICHSFTEDGRCISLLKILLTNHCIYDCAYCINRTSNDIKRTFFTPEELASITIEFYRRNYIEGLFLSSGVMRNPDYTMERLVAVCRLLREKHRFFGYIHLKLIPGASPGLIDQAGFLADRISVNIEIPSENNLKLLAPEKDYGSIYLPMNQIHMGIADSADARSRYRKPPRYAPAGQTTQLIVGASPETDFSILRLSDSLYREQSLKRVYYSGYVPVNVSDTRLPALNSPPLIRENRLYQADWLMRFYKFNYDEILGEDQPDLDPHLDPKLVYALRNPHLFPVDLNQASYETILRVPGIGVRSAKMIVSNRKFGSIGLDHLKKMGVALNRAKYFVSCRSFPAHNLVQSPEVLRRKFLKTNKGVAGRQLSFLWND